MPEPTAKADAMPEPTEMSIRNGTAGDAELIVGFLQALAAHSGRIGRCRMTPEHVLRFGFGREARFETLIAERAGEPAGLVLFYPIFSTWEACPGLFVNDLYVSDHHRGFGIGRRLLAEVARLALSRGCSRVEWQVLAEADAKGFYEALGGRRSDEFLIYRLADEDLARLARQGDSPAGPPAAARGTAA